MYITLFRNYGHKFKNYEKYYTQYSQYFLNYTKINQEGRMFKALKECIHQTKNLETRVANRADSDGTVPILDPLSHVPTEPWTQYFWFLEKFIFYQAVLRKAWLNVHSFPYRIRTTNLYILILLVKNIDSF